MTIQKIKTEGYASNCYMLLSGNEAAIVDPSAGIDNIKSALSSAGAELKYILLTHCHYDHMLSLNKLREQYSAPLCIHSSETSFLSDTGLNLFYFIGKDTTFSPAEIELTDSSELALGDERITVLHTPGHTAGSVCYLCGDDIVTGDTLFDMSVGRWDFPSGNLSDLSRSIKLLTTDYKDSKIHPGHGDSATMQKQIKFNPYTKGMI